MDTYATDAYFMSDDKQAGALAIAGTILSANTFAVDRLMN